MRRILLLSTLLLPLAGCNCFAYCAYLFVPEARAKTVEPECDLLSGRRVAIVVFAQPGVTYAYPRAAVDLSNALAYDLQQNINDLKVVPAATVLKFQRENLAWDTLPRRELARKLGADYVMHLGLEEYSLADSNSGMFRARVTADANLYAATSPSVAGDDSPVWTGRMRVIYPGENAQTIVAADDRAARGKAHSQFAKLLGRKFYKHTLGGDE